MDDILSLRTINQTRASVVKLLRSLLLVSRRILHEFFEVCIGCIPITSMGTVHEYVSDLSHLVLHVLLGIGLGGGED